ncbi:MAG: hypothetical protein ACKPKO_16305, partial [Candidatus Fonsibacter sp.]
RPSKADEINEDFVSKYQKDNTYPTDMVKSWQYTDKMQYRQDRRGIRRNNQLMGRALHAREESRPH